MTRIQRESINGWCYRLAWAFAIGAVFSLRLHAAAGGALPWETPMRTIATSLTGPVAYAIGLIGIAIAGGTMLWGGELTEFGRRACMIGLVVSVLVFAAPMLSSAFGVAAAVVQAMNTERPREIVIHQSANRPNQILGGDRELVLVTILISVSLAFSLATWWEVGLSILFWLTAIAVLQRMGKADPLLRQVYLRHIRYRPFYPAKSGLHARCSPRPARWR